MVDARSSPVAKAVCVLIAVCALNAAAQAQYGGGSGTEGDPYRIRTAEQMNEIGLHEADWDKHFILMDDIEMSVYTGTEYNIIGRAYDAPFTGVFDGRDNTIYDFTYTSTDQDNVALFGYLAGTVKNLNLANVNVRAERGENVGALVGINSGEIDTCSVTGNVLGETSVGGLVGYSSEEDDGMIHCCSRVSVQGRECVGGLAGRCDGAQQCYSISTVMGQTYVGGLVGYQGWEDTEIRDCYAGGFVSGQTYVGGLVGIATCDVDDCDGGRIERCYSTARVESTGQHVGGLVGANHAFIEQSYWDIQTSGMFRMCGSSEPGFAEGCDNACGMTTVQMRQRSTFKGWDFVEVWGIGEKQTYPFLRMGRPAGDVNDDGIVNALDLAKVARDWLDEGPRHVDDVVDDPPQVCVQWLGHASVKIRGFGQVIYVDPRNLGVAPHDATLVLVTHTHGDHYSKNDIVNVSAPGAHLFGPADVIQDYGSGQTILPGQTVEIDTVSVTGVPAYNTNKPNHPKDRNWLGFVVELAGRRIYCAGDTDRIPEMGALGQVDVAFLPVGGTYTMNADEAGWAARDIEPVVAIPYHWGTIVGTLADAERFGRHLTTNAKVMAVGETLCDRRWASDFSLLAHYELDESSGNVAHDRSADNDGTVHGEAEWRPVDGRIGGALSFDAVNDYIETPFILNPSSGPFSVYAWIKTDTPGRVILSQVNGVGTSASWLRTDASGRLMTELKDAGRGGAPLVSNRVVTDGQWHRVGVVWHGYGPTLYVDWESVAHGEQPGLEGGSGGLHIGAGPGREADLFWFGLIDDVRIYNRSVTPW